MPKKLWTNEELLDYVEAHSKTELALFHREHVHRFLLLVNGADFTLMPQGPEFLPMRNDFVQPLIDKARKEINEIKTIRAREM